MRLKLELIPNIENMNFNFVILLNILLAVVYCVLLNQ